MYKKKGLSSAIFATLLIATLVGLFTACSVQSQSRKLYDKFQRAKCEQRIAVYWYWISDNISVEGVEHDLEAMKKAGIDRAFIGNIWEGSVKPGSIKVLSPEWWEVLHAALKKATELDIEIGIFNCPGWSQSGGPWIEPQQSMRYLAQQQLSVEGNGEVQHLSLPAVGQDAQDVRVLAIPVTPHQSYTFEMQKDPGVSLSKEVHMDEPMTLRSILFETPAYLLVDVIVEAKVEGEYQTLRIEHLDSFDSTLLKLSSHDLGQRTYFGFFNSRNSESASVQLVSRSHGGY